MGNPGAKSPFTLSLPAAGPIEGPLTGAIEHALGLRTLHELYQEMPKTNSLDEFLESSLDALDISYVVEERQLARIPQQGPLIVISNHPFGGIEGIILGHLLRGVRTDVRILANFLLGRVEELRELFFLVDPFGSKSATGKNILPMRETLRWVKDGAVLGVFPSGTVSHLHLRQHRVTDPAWDPTLARMIRQTGATVLPVFFEGKNRALFQAAGLVHPLLRTAMLGRELLNKRGRQISVRIGKTIPFGKLESFAEDEDMLSYLRLRTYVLDTRPQLGTDAKPRTQKSNRKAQKRIRLAEVIPACDPSLMAQEVEALRENNLLVDSNTIQVYHAQAWQIPNVLREIGRLREISFRAVGEGTGREIDLDRYDRYYTHLFTWNSKKREIVGSYRMGKSDRISRHLGAEGLYTNSLFHYDTRLLEQMGPALELGRSFVRPEYQKNYSSLLMLWKGIGHYVARYPRYRMLFGTVSISNEYDSLSRSLILTFLEQNNFLPELAKLVTAKNPFRSRKQRGWQPGGSTVVTTLEDVESLIGEIEQEQRNIPVLLRQYLKMGGRLLGFNIDKEFGEVLDGLILVDMYQADRRALARYLGKEGMNHFLNYHDEIELTANGDY